ncbi:hypothetical protein SUGI_0256820 [Cryptomeria japonica]|nr:hypothetical protein SUGI_0256820 [Cryptomeria japonica]
MSRVGESMESKVQKVAGREVTTGNSNSNATMGGFKRLYMNFLHPLHSYSHHKHCSSLNEDVIRLSLSLFSVHYYERRLESFRTRMPPILRSIQALLQ